MIAKTKRIAERSAIVNHRHTHTHTHTHTQTDKVPKVNIWLNMINQNGTISPVHTLRCDTAGASIIKNSFRQLINIFFDDMGACM